MVFLNPTLLWALLGLGIPIGIHLWSKKQGKRIKIGSIKFLQASDSQKSRSIRLNELGLLLLRMLLTTILVLILAEPRLTRPTENTPLTYFVETSLLDFPSLKKQIDSLSLEADVRLLLPEFPPYAPELDEDYTQSQVNYWQLASEMQDFNTDSLVVFTNAYLRNVKGKRHKIHQNIHWIDLNRNQSVNQVVGVLQNRNKYEVFSVESDPNLLRVQKQFTESISGIADSIAISDKDTIHVSIFADEPLSSESRIIKASLSAIASYLNHPIDILEYKSTDLLTPSDAVVWLSETPAPPTKAKILRFRENALAKTLVTQGDSSDEFYLTTKLDTENIVQQDLGNQLINFLDVYPKIEHQVERYDQRVIDIEELKPSLVKVSAMKIQKEKKDISPYLWLIFFILILAERYISKRRKQ